jgi:hypothetical protein
VLYFAEDLVCSCALSKIGRLNYYVSPMVIKLIKFVFYRVARITPSSIIIAKFIDFIIEILVASGKGGAFVYRYFNIRLLEKSSSRWVESYDIIKDDELDKYIYKKITESGCVDVPFAKINMVSNGGILSIWQNGITIYKTNNVRIEPLSDIIKTADGVIWFKANKKTIAKELPCDVNIIHYDIGNRKVFAVKRLKTIYVDQAYSLFGVHITAWAHFIVEFLPKIKILNELSNVDNLVVLVPEGLDPHIKFLIEDNLASLNVKILYVDRNTEVSCNCLYCCSPVAYICNNATYTHVTDIVIPDYTRKIIASFFGRYIPELIKPQKVYIGRVGGRNIGNQTEIESLFKASNYHIVFPHLMSWQEKINTFGNATHIAGPGSSGFMNALFCHKSTKILSFINFERCFDPIFSQLISFYPNLDFWFLVGDIVGKQSINSSYKIDIEELKRFLIDTDFDQDLLNNM